MRPTRRFPPALLTLALQLFLAPAARAAGNPVTMTVSPAGELTLRLDGRPVATGAWHLRPDSYLPAPGPAPFDPGPVVFASATQDAPGRATVHEAHAAVTADYRYDLAGEDLRIAAHIVNTDRARSLKPVAFNGITFHFNPALPITGNLPTWYWTYLQAGGANLFHPGVANPVGCWWAADDRFGFSAFSESEFDHADLIAANWHGHDNAIPPDCQPEFYTDRDVPPGGSIDVTLSFRLSADRSLPHLIGPYKAVYDRRFPLPTYTPDDRPVGQFAATFESAISPRNPLGYNGDWRRLDTARGTAAFVRRTAPFMEQAGFVGMIFWSPGGYDPPMYPPDFDVLPPAVQNNIPALVKGFHDHGLRVGLAARPGDGVDRPTGAPPTVYRLSADDPEQMRVDLDRFRHAISMGFDMFYLDSFGGHGLNDVRILKQIRTVVGPDVLLYAEECTDMTLPWAGRYCEWTRDGSIRWDTPQQYAALRLLCPRATWICTSETGRPIPPSFARLGLTPVISDDDVARVRPAEPGQPPALLGLP